jgi:hypothetical protein
MATPPIKIRVFVQEDVNYANNGLGKHYSVTKMVFDRKTGMTLDHDIFGRGYSYEDACATKRRILATYAS